MELDEASDALGVPAGATTAEIRSAFRARLRGAHPDVHPNAAEGPAQTRLIIDAYRALSDAPPMAAAEPELRPEVHPTERSATERSVTERSASVRLDGPDTIVFDLPADEAFRWLLSVAHRIGDVTYLDRDNELLEALLRTTGGTTLSMVVTLQGRSNGTTEAFLTIEPLDVARGELPSINEVTALVFAQLTGLSA